MVPWYAAIGGDAVDESQLRAGLSAFEARPDVETLGAMAGETDLSGWIESDGSRAMLVFLLGGTPRDVASVLEVARTIAVSTKHPLRAGFSGTDAPEGTTADYATFEIDAAGTTRNVHVGEADRYLREHPPSETAPHKEDLWELLYAQLGDRGPDPVHASRVRELRYRMRPLAGDPRVGELIAAARGAVSVELREQSDGRTLARLVLSDGSRRLAFLTREQAEAFECLR